MNPPLPPDPLPSFSLYTMSIVIAIALFIQGTLIGLSTLSIKAYKGVLEAAIATLSLSAGFLVLVIDGRPDAAHAPWANILIICGFWLFYLAICRFTEQPFNRWLVFGLFPVSALALALAAVLDVGPSVFLYIRMIPGVVFVAGAGLKLLTCDHHQYRLSANITAIPFLTYALVMIGQMIAGFFSVSQVLPQPSISGIFSALALFILSYIWTTGFILMVSQRLQGALNELAMNDALTRVRNRRAMDQLLRYEMERVHEEIKDFSIILLDIDHFKRINDTYGHQTGDVVLQWFASSLQVNLRVQDVVARWGGEEFLVLLPDTLLDEATEIAERLRDRVASSKVEILEDSEKITFSAGIATSTTNRDVKLLCKIADEALYIAKQTRNRVVTQAELAT